MITFSFLVNPTREQIAQILSLYHMAGWWKPEPGAAALALRIIAGSHCFLVAQVDGEIVGMGRAISDGASDAYIQDVAVRVAHRHQGIGARIVSRIAERLLADGLSWVGLIAERNSQPFYQQVGFSKMPDAVPMLLNKL